MRAGRFVVGIIIRPGIRQCLDGTIRGIVSRIDNIPVLSASPFTKMKMLGLNGDQATACPGLLGKRFTVQADLSKRSLVRFDIADNGVAIPQQGRNNAGSLVLSSVVSPMSLARL